MIPSKEKKCSLLVRPLILTLLVIIIVGYSAWRVKDVVKGPELVIYSPIDGASNRSDLVKITGKAERISQLFINGRKVFTDEEGNFNENYLLANGYNALEIKALDNLGREKTKKIQLFFNQNS